MVECGGCKFVCGREEEKCEERQRERERRKRVMEKDWWVCIIKNMHLLCAHQHQSAPSHILNHYNPVDVGPSIFPHSQANTHLINIIATLTFLSPKPMSPFTFHHSLFPSFSHSSLCFLLNLTLVSSGVRQQQHTKKRKKV